jgi:SWI/SNF-related matrix-associated actin-dependent regulator of chromatin subfamily A3
MDTDVVFSTYATVTAEFCRGTSVLHDITWYRIVLDEG